MLDNSNKVKFFVSYAKIILRRESIQGIQLIDYTIQTLAKRGSLGLGSRVSVVVCYSPTTADAGTLHGDSYAAH